jgi:hypothetical protein
LRRTLVLFLAKQQSAVKSFAPLLTSKLCVKLIFIFAPMQQVIFEDLGTQPYKQTWDYQEKLLKQNVEVKSALRELQFAGAGRNFRRTTPPE